MQEEVNQKTIALVITASKITASILSRAIASKLAEERNRQKAGRQYRKQEIKNKAGNKGKVSVKALVGTGNGVSNIEINDGNIKSFERVARKYGIKYALKKDAAAVPPKYIVFFQGKDADVLNQAFKEYLKGQMKQKNKPSIKNNLQHFKERLSPNKTKVRNKQKDLSR